MPAARACARSAPLSMPETSLATPADFASATASTDQPGRRTISGCHASKAAAVTDARHAQRQPVATPPIVVECQPIRVVVRYRYVDVEHNIGWRQPATFEDRLINQPVLTGHGPQMARMNRYLQIAPGVPALRQKIEACRMRRRRSKCTTAAASAQSA
ncbi:MAG: hypothetical protein HT580_15570 [Dechloromonas sp.]|nr:MAG: hypothetical protein HT580_15570 [Dechloromonas sp.]